MTKRRFPILTSITTAAALVVALAVGANASETSQTDREHTSATAENTKYAPGEYFRGVYFGTGPVGKELPVLRKASLESKNGTPQAIADQKRMIELIRESDPGYLQGFAKSMKSGDHMRIADSLRSGTQNLFEAIKQLYPKFEPTKESDVTPKACSIALACAVTVVVGINYGVAVNVLTTIFVTDDVVGPSSTNDKHALLEQKVVQQITDNLTV